ncbi:hypothetical protein V6N11_029131 [Hibiscus sabdariffa]|uniref:Uncharacterized protein n=1 Tax=Hibiscus sabdariffa TaxID=183260 RepID=A0ABR2NRG3_9ROSI
MNELKDWVCSSWFAPVGSSSVYPLLSKWVMYGEITGSSSCLGPSDEISHVYSLWATFIGLYIVGYVVERVHEEDQQDDLFYDHLSEKKDLWFDFMTDTGDGGNSSYVMARLLAQPSLWLNKDDSMLKLSRRDLLLIGGDHVYVVFEEELPCFTSSKRWWVSGLDLSLHADIDVYQYQYFSELVKTKVLLLTASAIAFVPSKLARKKRAIIGVLHVSAHLVVALILMLLLELEVRSLSLFGRYDNFSLVTFMEEALHVRIANYKSFTRFYINLDSDLEVFTLAIDKVPKEWRLDPDWDAEAKRPQKWNH